uniref:Uncharacterized protein n=1 Tax=Aegilops tauschii TaxID=37682 RepID=M8CRH2_AEGTA
MGESLTEHCRVEVEGLQVVNFFSWRRNNDGWNPEQTAGVKAEEGEEEAKSSCPLCPGRHTCYNGRDKGSRSREGTLLLKVVRAFPGSMASVTYISAVATGMSLVEK